MFDGPAQARKRIRREEAVLKRSEKELKKARPGFWEQLFGIESAYKRFTEARDKHREVERGCRLVRQEAERVIQQADQGEQDRQATVAAAAEAAAAQNDLDTRMQAALAEYYAGGDEAVAARRAKLGQLKADLIEISDRTGVTSHTFEVGQQQIKIERGPDALAARQETRLKQMAGTYFETQMEDPVNEPPEAQATLKAIKKAIEAGNFFDPVEYKVPGVKDPKTTLSPFEYLSSQYNLRERKDENLLDLAEGSEQMLLMMQESPRFEAKGLDSPVPEIRVRDQHALNKAAPEYFDAAVEDLKDDPVQVAQFQAMRAAVIQGKFFEKIRFQCEENGQLRDKISQESPYEFLTRFKESDEGTASGPSSNQLLEVMERSPRFQEYLDSLQPAEEETEEQIEEQVEAQPEAKPETTPSEDESTDDESTVWETMESTPEKEMSPEDLEIIETLGAKVFDSGIQYKERIISSANEDVRQVYEESMAGLIELKNMLVHDQDYFSPSAKDVFDRSPYQYVLEQIENTQKYIADYQARGARCDEDKTLLNEYQLVLSAMEQDPRFVPSVEFETDLERERRELTADIFHHGGFQMGSSLVGANHPERKGAGTCTITDIRREENPELEQKNTQQLAQKHGANEVVRISLVREPIMKDEQYGGFLGFGKKTRKVPTGQFIGVQHKDRVDFGTDEMLYEFSYQTVDDERTDDYDGYQDYSKRPGQYMSVKILLPESVAVHLEDQLRDDPGYARELARQTALEKFAISEEDWETGSQNNNDHPLRPPYEQWAANKGGAERVLFIGSDTEPGQESKEAEVFQIPEPETPTFDLDPKEQAELVTLAEAAVSASRELYNDLGDDGAVKFYDDLIKAVRKGEFAKQIHFQHQEHGKTKKGAVSPYGFFSSYDRSPKIKALIEKAMWGSPDPEPDPDSADTLEIKKETSPDELPNLEEATKLIIQTGKASTSMLQRQLRIDYNEAAGIIQHLEDQGAISPPDGIAPRKVLIKEMPGDK